MGEEQNSGNFKDLMFLGFRSPRYTQVPDELFDLLLPRLSGAELKVLLYIVRRTFGWKKDSDRISLSQFENGITRRTGEVLDGGTGLSSRAVRLALQSLVEKNVLIKKRVTTLEKGHESTEYALNVIGGGAPSVKTTQGDDTPSVKSTEAPLHAESTQGLGDKVYKGLGPKVPTQDTVLQDTVNNNNVNVRHIENGEDTSEPMPTLDRLACAMVLAQDMLEVFGDRKSREFYSYASLKLADYESDIRFLLGSFKQDVVNNPRSSVKNPAALFVSKLKEFALEKGIIL
jgi:phage replication O-like protein O